MLDDNSAAQGSIVGDLTCRSSFISLPLVCNISSLKEAAGAKGGLGVGRSRLHLVQAAGCGEQAWGARLEAPVQLQRRAASAITARA